MRDPNLGCYYTGYNESNYCTISDFPERLDSQTWMLLSMQALAGCNGNDPNITGLIRNGLPWIDQYLYQVNYNNCNTIGFAKVTLGDRAMDSFWAEGTAGYVLAAAAACHSRTNQDVTLGSLHCLQDTNGSVPHSVGITFPEINEQFDPNDIILAHFESDPHCLHGKVGVYGDIAQGTGYYTPETPGYDPNNVHTGVQSFRLVSGTTNEKWASLGLDLVPKRCTSIVSRDVSDYSEFSFWAKTENTYDPNIEVLFRDTGSEVQVHPT